MQWIPSLNVFFVCVNTRPEDNNGDRCLWSFELKIRTDTFCHQKGFVSLSVHISFKSFSVPCVGKCSARVPEGVERTEPMCELMQQLEARQVKLCVWNIVICGEFGSSVSWQLLFSRDVVQAVRPTGESTLVSDRMGYFGTVSVKTASGEFGVKTWRRRRIQGRSY